ncbi:MAG: amidohydrolase family protein, partial [Candidatus Heimdallarchaeota archaeon]
TEEALKRLKDPKEREKIKKDIDQGIPGWENIVGRGDWNDILITFAPSEKNRQFMGKRIPEIANLVGKDPADTAFDLLIEEDLVVSMVTFWGSESLVYAAMRHPQGMFATDGLLGGKPHPRAYGTYPRILGKCVREDQIIALEEAVRKMTSFPAQRFGLRDRGLIREGMAGDITIFDPDHVLDKATFEDPIQFPEGIEYVLVNGVVVKEGNHHTGCLPGRVLRHQW